eukprot:1749696-Rhodomonas_salina.4
MPHSPQPLTLPSPPFPSRTCVAKDRDSGRCAGRVFILSRQAPRGLARGLARAGSRGAAARAERGTLIGGRGTRGRW